MQLKQEAFKDKEEYTTGLSIITERMKKAIGTKYDWWAIVWLGILYTSKGLWSRLFKKLPKRFNPLQNRNKFFCSELVCQSCYEVSSLHPYLFQGKTKQKCDMTTPKDISKSQWVKFMQGKNVN